MAGDTIPVPCLEGNRKENRNGEITSNQEERCEEVERTQVDWREEGELGAQVVEGRRQEVVCAQVVGEEVVEVSR